MCLETIKCFFFVSSIAINKGILYASIEIIRFSRVDLFTGSKISFKEGSGAQQPQCTEEYYTMHSSTIVEEATGVSLFKRCE